MSADILPFAPKQSLHDDFGGIGKPESLGEIVNISRLDSIRQDRNLSTEFDQIISELSKITARLTAAYVKAVCLARLKHDSSDHLHSNQCGEGEWENILHQSGKRSENRGAE